MDTRTIAVIAIVIILAAIGVFYLAGPGTMTTTETAPPPATTPAPPPTTPP